MQSLVTGGAGFIGSHIVRRLLNQGHRVRVLDNLSEGTLSNLEAVSSDIEFIEGDIRDEASVRRAVKGVEGIYHLAAEVSVPKSMEEPMLFEDVNARATLLLYEEAAKAGARRVVLSSTSAIYGDAECERNVETLTPAPLSPYALTKLAGELYGRIFTQSGKLEVACLRYFNVYGPRQSVTSAYAAVVPIFITRILDNKPITIFGDGEQTRDFVFAEDVAHANTLAMETPSAAGQVFNISGDNRISLNNLANDLRRLMPENKFEVNYAEPRAGDIKHSRADITKANETLGFIPKVTLSEGLERTIQAFNVIRNT